MNITGASIGRVAWVHRLPAEANVNQHVCIIRLREEISFPEYVSVIISTPYGQSQINSMQSGASRQGLNHQQVRKLEIPFPPISIQRAFTERIAYVRDAEAHQTISAQKFEKLYKSMLAKAFGGAL